jgi:hypothetical protein
MKNCPPRAKPVMAGEYAKGAYAASAKAKAIAYWSMEIRIRCERRSRSNDKTNVSRIATSDIERHADRQDTRTSAAEGSERWSRQ